MFKRIIFLLLLSLLSGCSGNPSKENVTSSVDKQEKNAPPQDTSDFQHTQSSNNQDELTTLFAQPFIDPLTDYLKQHAEDNSRSAQLDMVRTEIAERCQVVADRYATRPLTEESLVLYKAGYQYSCPDDVEAFAARLAETAPQTDSVTTQINKKQLNDCYLLTSISNFREAKQACLPPANQGDTRSQLNLIRVHRALGEYEQAVNWAKKAEPNSAEAAYFMGEFYASGQGVAKNDQAAYRWFKKASEQNNAEAQYRLAQCYEAGTGTQPNMEKAINWYQRAAENNHIPAKHALGALLIQQNQNPSNVERGQNWLIQAIRAGYNKSALLLGRLMQQSGRAEDKAQALVWYELAQKQGSAEAQALAESLRDQVANEAIRIARQQVNRILEAQN